jgi:two-component system nitrogen regulation response regulator GlnG
MDAIEKPLIEYVLERTYGNQIKAAKILGINRNTMRSKVKKLAKDVDRWKV